MIEKSEHVVAHMEQLGVKSVRDMLLSGRWPANYQPLAQEWLHKKDTEKRERDDADKQAQTFLAQRLNEVAHSARDAAAEAKKLAEEAGVMARKANSAALAAADSAERSAKAVLINNKIAMAALFAAIGAIAISVISFFVK